MNSCWLTIVLLLGFIVSVTINGDTYHYRVIRKICPSGSYHDPIKDRCRRVPGGGNLLKYNFDASCSHGFEGLLAHSKKSRYYFVCRHEAVLACICGPKEHFNRIRLRCEKKSKRMTKHDRRCHEVVDTIYEKYKCLANVDTSSDRHNPVVNQFVPEMTYRSIEVVNTDPMIDFQKLLTKLIELKAQLTSSEEVLKSTLPPHIVPTFRPECFRTKHVIEQKESNGMTTDIILRMLHQTSTEMSTKEVQKTSPDTSTVMTTQETLIQTTIEMTTSRDNLKPKTSSTINHKIKFPRTWTTLDVPETTTDKIQRSALNGRENSEKTTTDALVLPTTVSLLAGKSFEPKKFKSVKFPTEKNDNTSETNTTDVPKVDGQVMDEFARKKPVNVPQNINLKNMTIDELKLKFPARFGGRKSLEYDFYDEEAKKEIELYYIYDIYQYYYSDEPNITLWEADSTDTTGTILVSTNPTESETSTLNSFETTTINQYTTNAHESNKFNQHNLHIGLKELEDSSTNVYNASQLETFPPENLELNQFSSTDPTHFLFKSINNFGIGSGTDPTTFTEIPTTVELTTLEILSHSTTESLITTVQSATEDNLTTEILKKTEDGKTTEISTEITTGESSSTFVPTESTNYQNFDTTTINPTTEMTADTSKGDSTPFFVPTESTNHLKFDVTTFDPTSETTADTSTDESSSTFEPTETTGFQKFVSLKTWIPASTETEFAETSTVNLITFETTDTTVLDTTDFTTKPFISETSTSSDFTTDTTTEELTSTTIELSTKVPSTTMIDDFNGLLLEVRNSMTTLTTDSTTNDIDSTTAETSTFETTPDTSTFDSMSITADFTTTESTWLTDSTTTDNNSTSTEISTLETTSFPDDVTESTEIQTFSELESTITSTTESSSQTISSTLSHETSTMDLETTGEYTGATEQNPPEVKVQGGMTSSQQTSTPTLDSPVVRIQDEFESLDYHTIHSKADEIEYYYIYEDYEVNENPTVNPQPIQIKQKRDNSFEYYVESISASREFRKNRLSV